MAAKYHLTQRDRDFIGRTLKEFKGRGRGELPLPKRRRTIEGGGGGGSTLRKARVTTEITAAASAAETDWGTGEVDLCDATTGEPGGTSEAVDNEWPTTFGVDYQVLVDTSHSPPRVVGGTCEAQDAATYWGDS